LKITLQSVLEQTSSIFEYVVVDGGSTDGTFDLLMEYSSKFQELGIPFRFVSEHDKGTYDAMNKGASLAKGEWVNYMNAGDSFYSRSTLEDFFSNSILSQCGVIYGDTFQIYDFGSGVAKKCDYEKDNKVMPFCHQSCFVKAELMRQYKFNTSYNVEFSTYAVPMIMGEIRRFLRDDGIIKVSRSLKETATLAKKASEKIYMQKGSDATLLEISEMINCPVDDIECDGDCENCPCRFNCDDSEVD
jgi:glycosyltransferase involved in cell wall biosynthesis